MRHPFKVDVMHVDFQRVDAKKKMNMHVQLHFTGEELSPGVKSGGQVNHVVNEVEVSCLISKLETGESIHLTELNVPKGVELTALSHGDENHDTAVVSIHTPKVVVETEDDEPAADDDAAAATEE